VTSGNAVVGYYTLANGAVYHQDAPGNLKRNMPDPIPVMVLGRLAVHKDFQGKGIGSGLLKDALLRTLQAAEIAGMRAVVVHAISPEAKRFYLDRGFRELQVEEMSVMLSIDEIGEALGEE
jgi:GNAT superfamily N-acetyltransferase